MIRKALYVIICFGAMTGFYYAVKWTVLTVDSAYGHIVMLTVLAVWIAICYAIARRIDKRDATAAAEAEVREWRGD